MNSAPESALFQSGTGGNIRLVAFYLPQFHPIPENDEWWGKGFTEWTNASRAEPLFAGHYQPHLPADLGFYDLRLKEIRREQIKLAKAAGIDAFCYHYYWFSGKRLLEKPLDDMLADKESDMPFCLCWANENWTRRWNGGDQDILAEQKYLPEDRLRFVEDIAPYILDPRYIRVDGRPLLIIYRPQNIPDIRATAEEWRKHFRQIGVGEVHLCAALIFNNLDYTQFGFDSGVEFPPHNRVLLGVNCVNTRIQFHQPFMGCVMRYHDLANAYLNRDQTGQNIFRAVFPSWDNTARSRHQALIFINGTPENYEHWLSRTIAQTRQEHPNSDRLVFINAWNEWAEGCHLEPDQKHGRKFLEATLRAKNGLSTFTTFPDTGIPEESVADLQSFPGDIKRVFQIHGSLVLRLGFERIRMILERNPGLKRFLKKLLRA